ncbi:MAG: transglutaminase family protein [Magnetococcales bacterium]|nr:transglutaminase family protein [Magnetococcales bacterium]
MSIRVAIHHHTAYRYDRPVILSPHVFRLRPAPHCRTPIESYSLKIRPPGHFINWQQDPFGNFLARVVFLEPCRELVVDVEVVARMVTINPFDFFLDESAREFPFVYEPDLRRDLAPYLEVREESPLLERWLAGLDHMPQGTVDYLVEVNRRLCQAVGYTIRLEPGVQSCQETLSRKTGSCRDSGWLLVQALRRLGLAARFVSGYLVQLTPDVKSLDGPSGPAQDFTDLHAWCEVYVPGAGWIGLDPTSGLFAGEGHIPLACTPDPASAAPVTGATDRCETQFSYRNTVTRIHEDPRVTKPYTDAQWQAIDALGRQVDAELAAGDVRLTMGGEPTFVSVDDMEGPEWTVAADGPHKRERARDLLQRLADRFAPGGVLHFGQGKLYPGEVLPRWRFACCWRTDGVPLWSHPDLQGHPTRDDGVDVQRAATFAKRLAERLGGLAGTVFPAHEDPFHALWLESQQPLGLDPLQARLDDPLERQALARMLNHGLQRPVGFALPLEWDQSGYRWKSCRWGFRRGRLFLIPGDSPMGYRLPLASLHWCPPEQRPIPPVRCVFEPRVPLPPTPPPINPSVTYPTPNGADRPAVDAEEFDPAALLEQFVGTALCVEPRQGRLHVFLPPLSHLEGFVVLLQAIEATAVELGIPVLLEGYPPPEDWRLAKFYVTPDPGVIEVNIHPARSWEELVANTTVLYEEAHLARLGTEKFLLDGRHTGTGGGNHVTLGGATPADSPLLRRPELLASLITYWQHHPGLSYLFSSLFIGPTSQAPRIDEGRDAYLYELDIALAGVPAGEESRPWLADRLLRHLLVDIAGNTHRTEFCIDKLYSPDSPTGRLGLLELRAFEMPPHARMSLVQMLLLRTLVARFWKTPYRKPLIRWGTALHDRFMLPHFVQRDLEEVTAELREAGYPFQDDWLDPFVEFRFPKFGEIQVQDIHLELRQALEPWHVLGEEVVRNGTARFVDSSVERLQVRVTGLTPGRHGVTCNGRQLPLHNTGTVGDHVAGVRFKAWQPPSALHPLIGVHAPLVFDVIDLWHNRALGGCTYYVSHPGGRSYDTFPVNSYEAEARRISRFWDLGHSPGVWRSGPAPHSGGRFVAEGSGVGPIGVPVEGGHPEYPTTLDLRRPE